MDSLLFNFVLLLPVLHPSGYQSFCSLSISLLTRCFEPYPSMEQYQDSTSLLENVPTDRAELVVPNLTDSALLV